MRCPCRKKSERQAYEECCGRFHSGAQHAPTAEALMRSRYSAFVMGNAPYLLATWHPTTRPATLDFTPGQEWLLLRVVGAREDGDTATVSFVALARLAGKRNDLSEVSSFVREHGRWLYVRGEIQ